MIYRSPSPDNLLPTPPQSPAHLHGPHPAVDLLHSLEAFYHHERSWVHHTRAALELAITKGIDASPPSPIQGPPSPASSSSDTPTPTATSTTTTTLVAPTIKSEPDLSPSSLSRADATRWMRRKNTMRLKLDGLSLAARKRRPPRAPPTEPAAHLLEMFSELMDARIESCQRVHRMVRNANRADLHMR